MVYFSDSFVDFILSEDIERGDLTTRALGISGRARAEFISRESGLCAGVALAAKCCSKLGLEVQIVANDGDLVQAGGVIFRAQGEAVALHQAYKVAQSVLEFCCGVARCASRMQAAARAQNPSARLLCTRKAPPACKQMCAAALFAAGVGLHRAGLAESVLIFDSHRALLNTSAKEQIARAKAHAPEHKIMAEAKNMAQLHELIEAGADIVQCDKFSPEQLRRALQLARAAGVQLSAAGGITEANIGEFAASGVDILISSAPYYAPCADIKVSVARA